MNSALRRWGLQWGPAQRWWGTLHIMSCPPPPPPAEKKNTATPLKNDYALNVQGKRAVLGTERETMSETGEEMAKARGKERRRERWEKLALFLRHVQPSKHTHSHASLTLLCLSLSLSFCNSLGPLWTRAPNHHAQMTLLPNHFRAMEVRCIMSWCWPGFCKSLTESLFGKIYLEKQTVGWKFKCCENAKHQGRASFFFFGGEEKKSLLFPDITEAEAGCLHQAVLCLSVPGEVRVCVLACVSMCECACVCLKMGAVQCLCVRVCLTEMVVGPSFRSPRNTALFWRLRNSCGSVSPLAANWAVCARRGKSGPPSFWRTVAHHSPPSSQQPVPLALNEGKTNTEPHTAIWCRVAF